MNFGRIDCCVWNEVYILRCIINLNEYCINEFFIEVFFVICLVIVIREDGIVIVYRGKGGVGVILFVIIVGLGWYIYIVSIFLNVCSKVKFKIMVGYDGVYIVIYID